MDKLLTKPQAVAYANEHGAKWHSQSALNKHIHTARVKPVDLVALAKELQSDKEIWEIAGMMQLSDKTVAHYLNGDNPNILKKAVRLWQKDVDALLKYLTK